MVLTMGWFNTIYANGCNHFVMVDLKAIYAYLRSIKPLKNKVDKWPQ